MSVRNYILNRCKRLNLHLAWLGFAIGLIALALALKDIRLAEVLAALRSADYGLVVLAFMTAMMATVGSVVRWRLLLHPHRSRLGNLFLVYMIAHLGSALLPWKLGTVLRAYLAAESEEIQTSFVLGTVVVERVIDAVILVILFAGLVLLIPLPGWMQASGLSIGFAAIPLFVVMVLAAYYKDGLLAKLKRLSGKVPPGAVVEALGRRFESVLDSMGILRRSGAYLPLVGWSVVVWGAGALTNWVALAAVGVHVPVIAAFVLLVALQLSSKLPSLPGNIGVFHYVTVLTLSIFGVEKALALSYAFVLHAVVFVGPGLLGALCLWKWQYDFGNVYFRNPPAQTEGGLDGNPS